MIRRPPRSTQSSSSAASDVYKRQERFKAQRRTAKFCSAKCRNEAGRRRRTGTGPQVGMVIEQRAASVADRPRMALVAAVEAELDMLGKGCLLYTSDAADDLLCVDLGGRRILKKKNYLTTSLLTHRA